VTTFLEKKRIVPVKERQQLNKKVGFMRYTVFGKAMLRAGAEMFF
jgi:hypothetical protein